MEVTAVDLAAIGKTEQALRIEPDAIRLFSRCVVFVGMTEGALALKVISGRCRLGQSGYHGASSVTTLPGQGYNLSGVQLGFDCYSSHDSSFENSCV